MIPIIPVSVPMIPFYSQFSDIHTAKWQKVGCGITSLAMVIDYYSTSSVSVDELLAEGVKRGAYSNSNGWIHSGLIALAKKYHLEGESVSVATLSRSAAIAKLQSSVEHGPVLASVHYLFNPKSTIPHIVVVSAIKDGMVYYNDPAAKSGQKKISQEDFEKAWKKKFIVIRPEIRKADTAS